MVTVRSPPRGRVSVREGSEGHSSRGKGVAKQ
jgi:hypothetical protein